MEIKKRVLGLMLVLVLSCGLYAQTNSVESADLEVQVVLHMVEIDGEQHLAPDFTFSNLDDTHLRDLSEIFIKFRLVGDVLQGSHWPTFLLSAHCVEDDRGIVEFYMGPNKLLHILTSPPF